MFDKQKYRISAKNILKIIAQILALYVHTNVSLHHQKRESTKLKAMTTFIVKSQTGQFFIVYANNNDDAIKCAAQIPGIGKFEIL